MSLESRRLPDDGVLVDGGLEPDVSQVSVSPNKQSNILARKTTAAAPEPTEDAESEDAVSDDSEVEEEEYKRSL